MEASEFKEIRLKLGLSQEKIGALIGIKTRQQINNFERGKIKINPLIADKMLSLCKKNLHKNDESDKSNKLGELNAYNPQNSDTSDNQITIPFYKDFAVSAGFGATNFEGEVELIPFNKNELRAMFGVVSFNKMGIVSVVGDSMYPTLKEGQMLIFQDDGSSIEGGIYIIEYQNEVFVKRLKKRPLSLVSDNKEYSNIEVKDLEELRIIGRVIGAYEIIYKRM
ncbi:LexA family transcriptional regulator [Helicobacter sp.]|uniref:LexA family transcriptional regulator n=1 Tax=Helicobacter sp. TaxID=218 RepID=UPI0025C3E2E3|nr:LexA family transcriptional regulator [Helicobacter sp.]MCI5969144.1 LexA family transcriptional regulator [Helicobacter sp.]